MASDSATYGATCIPPLLDSLGKREEVACRLINFRVVDRHDGEREGTLDHIFLVLVEGLAVALAGRHLSLDLDHGPHICESWEVVVATDAPLSLAPITHRAPSPTQTCPITFPPPDRPSHLPHHSHTASHPRVTGLVICPAPCLPDSRARLMNSVDSGIKWSSNSEIG